MKLDPAIIFLLATVISLIIERVFYYRSKYSHKKNNPTSNFVSLPRFHQEFKDFKKQQEKFNDEIKADFKEIDKRIDNLEKSRK